jgi:hypothetical protein
MQTLILALARSGSSALYHMIHDSLPSNKQSFFEPNDKNDWQSIIESLGSYKFYTVKSIMRPYLRTQTNYVKYFNKSIILVRDPRDNLISRLLFRLISPVFQENLHQCTHIYKLLQKKIESPSSIPLIKIYQSMEETGLMENFIENRVRNNLDLLTGFYEENPNSFVFKYENLIERKLDKLNEYLGFELNPLIREIPRIKREGKKGNWRHWFTDVDIDYFQPRMNDFIKYFDYDNDWKPCAEPVIEKEHSIDYINKNFKRNIF